MKPLARCLLLAGAGLLLAPLALAQTTVLTGASVYTGWAEEPERVSIVIRGKSIAYVGNDQRRIPPAGPGVEVVPLQGKIITPGFIDSFSTLGIEEVGLSRANDAGPESELMAAAVNPALAFNPRSSQIPIFLEEGVTQALLRHGPSQGILAGQLAMVALDADPHRHGPPQGMLAYLGETGRRRAGDSRAAALQTLQAALEEARDFRANPSPSRARLAKDLQFPWPDLQALAAVVRGETKLALYVNRAADIEAVLNAFGPGAGLDLVLVGAREAWKVAEQLARRDVPVILNPMDNLPSSFDQLGARLDQPALLHEAGVRFAFMSESLYTNSRMLSQSAGIAVAYGLPWIEGLRAITRNPAQIWGLDALGSLDPGKEATLVVWNADPLELTSHAERIMLAGQWAAPVNRQRLLRDRYRDIDDHSKPFGYR